MTRLILGLLVCLVAAPTGVAQQRAIDGDGRVPVLAELFTSEGCSSCPPADGILELLARDQPIDGVYVVAMSEHVTYWDRLGWKDPFGSSRLTMRQSMYASRFKLESVFTPQLVIDGEVQMVGTDMAGLRRALEHAARSPKPSLTVAAAIDERGTLHGSVSGPGLQAGAAEGADVLWAITEDDLVVEVKRGENAKQTLRHSAVVRTLESRKIGPDAAAGKLAVSLPLKTEWKRDRLRLIVFVQAQKSKRVLSVGWTRP